MKLDTWSEDGHETPNLSVYYCFYLGKSMIADVDFVTPLCTQVTYEGLLDDTFGISSGFIEFGPEVTGTDKSMKMLLTAQDMVSYPPEFYNGHVARWPQIFLNYINIVLDVSVTLWHRFMKK